MNAGVAALAAICLAAIYGFGDGDGEELRPLLAETDAMVTEHAQFRMFQQGRTVERAIPLALYTRNGRLKRHLAPEVSKNLPLRLAQYRAALDEGAVWYSPKRGFEPNC